MAESTRITFTEGIYSRPEATRNQNIYTSVVKAQSAHVASGHNKQHNTRRALCPLLAQPTPTSTTFGNRFFDMNRSGRLGRCPRVRMRGVKDLYLKHRIASHRMAWHVTRAMCQHTCVAGMVAGT